VTRPLGIVVALLSAAAGCAPGRAREEMTLVVGRPTDAIGLDPAGANETDSAEVVEQIYENLVRYRRGSTTIEPGLAERWDVSADGTRWVFHLRPGVRFHDGTPLDADAVVFSFDRQRDPSHPYHNKSWTYYAASFRNIVSVDKLDPLTVSIEIERAYAPFLANLATTTVSIVSPTAVKKWGDQFAYHPVGTGPFRFVEWSRGDRITLAANHSYWDGAPKIEHLSFVAVRDARQRLSSIEGGAIDVAERLAPEDLQFVALHPELKIERIAGNNVSYLAMNNEKPPFDDPRVRVAVAHAINKLPIVKMVFQGLATPATGALAPSMWGHVDLNDYRYDPDLARRELAEAGWTGQRRPKLYVVSTPRPYLPSPEQVARIIARNLHDVGMDVELVSNPMAQHVAKTAAGEHDLCILGWNGDNGDPDNFLYSLFDSDNAEKGNASNLAFFRDNQVHGLLHWAQETQDRAQRELYYAQAQHIILDKAPWVPIAHAEIVVARRREVQGLELRPSASLEFVRAEVAAR
jgi:peptide/nickel transport system substrate-binding protein